MLFSIIPANLEIASILAQANVKHPLCYNPWLYHGVKNRLFINSLFSIDRLHTQDSVSLLLIKQSSFSLNTSKGEEKAILRMIIITEVQFVANNIALIRWSFLIALIKLTIIAVSTSATFLLTTIVCVCCLTLVKFKPWVNVWTATGFAQDWWWSAEVGTRDCCNCRPCIYYQSLFVFIWTKCYVDVEILDVGGVAEKTGTLQMNVHKVTPWWFS